MNPYVWALAVRALVTYFGPYTLSGDAGDFNIIATNVASGNGFSRCGDAPFPPTAQRPPLYPLILSVMLILGVGRHMAPALLNAVMDLISMRFAYQWGRDQRFKFAGWIPWLIGFCPFLIMYGPYPTTENMSVAIFFLAVVLTFKKRALASGFLWGLLALCRSYFILFPLAFALFRPLKGWRTKSLALIVVGSVLAPAAWMTRNYLVFGKAVFSQSSMSGWQAYQGVAIRNFDWWNPEHAAKLHSHPILSRMMASHCLTDDQIETLDKQVRDEVYGFVVSHPFEVATNIVIKTVMLFTNWGQIAPYTKIPEILKGFINMLLCLYWWCVLMVLFGGTRKLSSITRPTWFALLCVFYVTVVTIPFAVDARYLLGPFLILLICVLEEAKGPRKLITSGLASQREPRAP